ncbi:hypothetical protein [Cronobacter dublinensis]|uniref:hypothetical protein n=1 Tax=Cronobacter dublinensis TaxID=413497 RepID=UPI0028944B83|nr:hypothetical protein [Cronobacter dublinensis]MDT3605970.1 hypothetical protein [Cronobacter dublinensis]
MKNDELIAAGHELAKCLDNEPLLDIAKMIISLADKLDVTTAALREKTKQCDAEHNDVLVWEKTMFKVCGEDGVKSVAEKFASLEASRAALAAENTAIKALNDCLSEELRGYESDGAFEGPKMNLLWWKTETPATDAFIAEQRAQGVDMFAKHIALYNSNAESHAKKFAAELRQGGAA